MFRAIELIFEHPIATFFIVLVLGGVITDIVRAAHGCATK